MNKYIPEDGHVLVYGPVLSGKTSYVQRLVKECTTPIILISFAEEICKEWKNIPLEHVFADIPKLVHPSATYIIEHLGREFDPLDLLRLCKDARRVILVSDKVEELDELVVPSLFKHVCLICSSDAWKSHSYDLNHCLILYDRKFEEVMDRIKFVETLWGEYGIYSFTSNYDYETSKCLLVTEFTDQSMGGLPFQTITRQQKKIHKQWLDDSMIQVNKRRLKQKVV